MRSIIERAVVDQNEDALMGETQTKFPLKSMYDVVGEVEHSAAVAANVSMQGEQR